MAESQAFDVLIVREIDRLSRSLAKQLIIEQELKKQNVEIEYVMGDYPDTPEGNFMRHIRATVAEYEREKINERVIRGRYSKVKAGSVFVSGHAPLGYKLVQENNQYRFEIEEAEAEVVRMIYNLYLSGLSARKIAVRLSDLGVPSIQIFGQITRSGWAQNDGQKGHGALEVLITS
ncbi:MAG: recombinase family protein [Litorilinea sp.]